MAGRYFRISGCFAHAYGSYQYLNPRTGVVEVFGDQTGVGEGDTFGVPYFDEQKIKAFVYVPEELMYMFSPVEENRITIFDNLDAAYDDAKKKHFFFADQVDKITGPEKKEQSFKEKMQYFIWDWISKHKKVPGDIFRRYNEAKIAFNAKTEAEFLREQERRKGYIPGFGPIY